MNHLITQYKSAMCKMRSSVSILTHRKGAQVSGMTVTSASSYSAEPPIFFAAIHRDSTLAGVLSLGDPLTMNLLATDHLELARRFSGETGIHGDARFDEGDWSRDGDHAPILNGSLATFSGHLRALIPQASHAILLVEIDEVIEGNGEALTYCERSYSQS